MRSPSMTIGLARPSIAAPSGRKRIPRAATCGSAKTPAMSLIGPAGTPSARSEEHTSELQSLMRISYAVFCLKKQHDVDTAPKDRANTSTIPLQTHLTSIEQRVADTL